jgi:hypothetical protein
VHVISLCSVCTDSSAAKMLNQVLVTKQTGPQGKVVGKVSFANLIRSSASLFLYFL